MNELIHQAIHPEMILDEVLEGFQDAYYFRLLHFIYLDYETTKINGLWVLIEEGEWLTNNSISKPEFYFQYHLINEWYHFDKQMSAPIKASQKEINKYLKGE